jgi:hypothetical protein
MFDPGSRQCGILARSLLPPALFGRVVSPNSSYAKRIGSVVIFRFVRRGQNDDSHGFQVRLLPNPRQHFEPAQVMELQVKKHDGGSRKILPILVFGRADKKSSRPLTACR